MGCRAISISAFEINKLENLLTSIKTLKESKRNFVSVSCFRKVDFLIILLLGYD